LLVCGSPLYNRENRQQGEHKPGAGAGGQDMKVRIQVKKIGKNRGSIVPVIYEYPETADTVRKLLEETVRINRKAYGERRKHTEVEAVLSGENIEEQARGGKVTFGLSRKDKVPEFREAVENAWQCFEDGIVVVFLDGKKLERLEEKMELRENSELVFVRMTMLAGRMW
jgi:hypothetical protein